MEAGIVFLFRNLSLFAMDLWFVAEHQTLEDKLRPFGIVGELVDTDPCGVFFRGNPIEIWRYYQTWRVPRGTS